MCEECGRLVCFADDSTYTVTAKDEHELSLKLSGKFQVMSEYLTENRLCINTDKTHMMVLCTEQKRRHIDTQAVMLNTGSEIIQATEVEKLLGYEVHQNLGFGTFLMTGKNSVLSSLSKRIGALKSIAKVSNFKTRLLLLGDVKNSLYAAIVWWSTKLYAGCSTEKTERGNETGDQEKMGRSWTFYIDQRTFEAVQLPECQANGVLSLSGISAQDPEERGS